MISSDEHTLHQMLAGMTPWNRAIALAASIIEHDPNVLRQTVILTSMVETMGKHLSERDRLELAALLVDVTRELVATWH